MCLSKVAGCLNYVVVSVNGQVDNSRCKLLWCGWSVTSYGRLAYWHLLHCSFADAAFLQFL